MDELALATGLLAIVSLVTMVSGFALNLPAWFARLVAVLIGVTLLCASVNGGLALGHMIWSTPP